MSTQAQRGAPIGPGGAEAALRLASMLRDPLIGYLRLAADYGDAVRVPMSPRSSFFLLSRPEHAEYVLAQNQDNFVKAFTYRPLRALIGNGLLTSEGEDWRRHRRLVQPLFSRREVRAFGPAMTTAAGRMLKQWDALPAASEIDVAGQMSALALDVVGRALFGTDLTSEAELIRRAMDAGQRVAVLATFVPLPWGPRSTRMLKAVARRAGRSPEGVEGPVGRMIADRRARHAAVVAGTACAVEAGSADAAPGGTAAANGAHGAAANGAHGTAADGRQDLLDLLITARREDGSHLTDTEISDELATFMLAGHETSAVTLSWALALLSAYPAAREQVEQEVDAVLGNREPEAADTDKLRWTTAVIAETMRLYRRPGPSSGMPWPTTTWPGCLSRPAARSRSRPTWCTG